MNLRLRFTHGVSAEGWIRSYEQKNERRSTDPPEKKSEVPKSMDPGKAKVTLIRNGYPLVKSAKKAAGFSRTEGTKGSRGHTHGLFAWLEVPKRTDLPK